MKRSILASLVLALVLSVSSSFSTPTAPQLQSHAKHIALKPFGQTRMWSPTVTCECLPVTWELNTSNDPGYYMGAVRFLAGKWYMMIQGYVSAYTAGQLFYWATYYDGDDYDTFIMFDAFLHDVGPYDFFDATGQCTYTINF